MKLRLVPELYCSDVGVSTSYFVDVLGFKIKYERPTNALNKPGYNIEFNTENKYKNYSIDFQALAAHIVELHRHARKYGHDIRRVIFAPELQPYLYKTQYADYLLKHIQFSKKRSWVRHDEHYHIDFDVACK